MDCEKEGKLKKQDHALWNMADKRAGESEYREMKEAIAGSFWNKGVNMC